MRRLHREMLPPSETFKRPGKIGSQARRLGAAWALAGGLLTLPSSGRADPRAPRTVAATPWRSPDSAHDPGHRAPPTDVSGIAVPDRSQQVAQRWQWVPRVILFPARLAVDMVARPVKLGLLMYERYELKRLFYRVFYNDDRTIGFYPIARLESGFGAYVGARFIHKSAFGAGEHIRGEIGRGQRYGEVYAVEIDSGNRIAGGTKLFFRAAYRQNPSDLFFGIGNGERTENLPEGERLAPRSDTAIRTRFTHIYAVGAVEARHRFDRYWTGGVVHRWRWARFGDASILNDDPALDRVYDPSTLVGYQTGLANMYIGYRLALDSRRWAPHVSLATPTRGGLIQGEVGYTAGIATDPSNYVRMRVDLQWFVHLFGGDRVLRLRAFVDRVWGSSDAIPFVDFPTIGGPYYLRGYPRARFRDRLALLANVEYIYPIDTRASGFLFIDPGGVWQSLADLNVGQTRLGYGGGVEIHGKRSFLFRLQLASSLEGGIQVQLNFDPGYAHKNR